MPRPTAFDGGEHALKGRESRPPPSLKNRLLLNQPRPIRTFAPNLHRAQRLDELARAFIRHCGKLLSPHRFYRLPPSVVFRLRQFL